MFMKPQFVILALVMSTGLNAQVREQPIEYQTKDTHLKGVLVWDDTKGAKQPGVLVVHEWWGLNDYAKKRAHMLADLGYIALAVDMYGEGRNTDHPKEAAEFMRNVTDHADLAKQRFLAAMSVLQAQASVDPARIAAIGYCFGGSTVLNMAREGLDLKAVVSFHGNLATSTPAKKGQVKAQVLVLNGADDSFVSADSIKAFKQEMANAGARYEFIDYPGAKHSFTNPEADFYGKKYDLPLAYNADADQRSWNAMRELLSKALNH